VGGQHLGHHSEVDKGRCGRVKVMEQRSMLIGQLGRVDRQVEKARILHLVHTYGTAGMEGGVMRVVNNCDPSRFKLFLCSLTRNRGGLERIGGQVFYVEMHGKPGLDPLLLFRLVHLMREHRIHVVHSHNWGTFFYGVVAAWIAGVKVVVHGEHGKEASDLAPSPFRKRVLQRWLAARCTQLVTVTHDLKNEIVSTWGVDSSKVKVIYNGLNLSLYGQEWDLSDLRVEIGVEPGDPIVGSVGRLRPVKNFGLLLEAMVLVIKELPRTRLVLVGGGKMEESLKGLARTLGIDSKVIFLGSRADVHRLISLFDVFVLPSLYEGMSNTILEAMACSRPIVATRVGGNPELVEDGLNGYLVPPRDANALAERIITLLQNPDQARRFGRAGRDIVEKRHQLKAMVRANEEMYWTLCQRAYPALFSRPFDMVGSELRGRQNDVLLG